MYLMLVLITCLLSACAGPSDLTSKSKDIASNWGTNPVVHHYHIHDGFIIQGTCDRGTSIYNRANCSNQIRKAELKKFVSFFLAQHGDQLDEFSRQMNEALVNIDLIDTKLLELLSVEPDVVRTDLKADMLRIENRLSELATLLTELDLQMHDVKTQLSTSEDPDLRSLMTDLTEKADRYRREQTTEQTNLNTVRNQYVTANSGLLNQQTFQDLQVERRRHLGNFVQFRNRTNSELTDLVHGNNVLKRLHDQSFTYTYLDFSHPQPSTTTSAQRIRPAFDRANLLWRTFDGSLHQDRAAYMIKIDRQVGLKEIKCEFAPVNAPACNQVGISRNDREVLFPGKNIHLREWNIPNHFPDTSATGDWFVFLKCGAGGVPDHSAVSSSSCKIIVAD